MKYVVLVLVFATVIAQTLAYVNARFDSLQADINLLNADVQALDYLRKPALPEMTAPVRRTEFFI